MDQRFAIQGPRALGQSYSVGVHHSRVLNRGGTMLLRVRERSKAPSRTDGTVQLCFHR